MRRIERIVGGQAMDRRLRRGGWFVAIAVTVIAGVAAGFAFNAVDSANVQAVDVAQPVVLNVEADAEDGALDAYAAKLDALIASGDLTEEQAAAKLTAAVDKGTPDKPPFSLEEFAVALDAKVESGAVTSEEADVKLAAISNKNAADKPEISLEDWATKFEAMVASGKMTTEGAEAKLAALAS